MVLNVTHSYSYSHSHSHSLTVTHSKLDLQMYSENGPFLPRCRTPSLPHLGIEFPPQKNRCLTPISPRDLPPQSRSPRSAAPRHLPHISHTSPTDLPHAISPTHLPHISHTSPTHLPHISHTSPTHLPHFLRQKVKETPLFETKGEEAATF